VGSRDYLRLRVGVGKPATGVADFLLAPFSEPAEERLVDALSLASDAVALVARLGIERAMNQVNRQATVGLATVNQATASQTAVGITSPATAETVPPVTVNAVAASKGPGRPN
jgi:hypothetical protein